MKNIHLIPTDNKYSRLYFNVNDKEFQICEIEKSSTILKPNRHIYITSDEEIKEGDWLLIIDDFETYIHKHKGDNLPTTYHKKIILTTDQDLIKDGVQAIDDEFLEWFVNNSSCDEVEVNYGFFTPSGRQVDPMGILQNHSSCVWKYKIIIPKEEKDYTALLKPVGTKQSAVEWLVNHFADNRFLSAFEEEIEQAKEMEKQQQGYSEEKVYNLLEQIGKSEFLQKLRATKSDAEARRLIFETFKKK